MSDHSARAALPNSVKGSVVDGSSDLVSLFATSSPTAAPSSPQTASTTVVSNLSPISAAPSSTASRMMMPGGALLAAPAMHDAGGTMHGAGAAHSHNSGQHTTHPGLLELVPHSRATHTAINNGSWFSASTWKEGKIPGDGARVVIQDGVSVTYDAESDARLETIRVDGTLSFASRANTKVLVDTFVVAPEGTLQIGSERNPVGANFKTQIIFTADGAIDRSQDPTLLGRGLLSHGKARIHGADKTDFVALQAEAAAGDNVLVLKEVPQGWRVGDQLVLGGTEHRYGKSDQDNSRFRDEELTITKIDGKRVYFTNNDIQSGDNEVLRFDHQLPDVAERNQLQLYVANTTRNVSFETENADSVPLQRRAHVMFMHNPDVVVENAGFYGLGRSDKTKLVDDPGTNVDGTPGRGTNRRGRYGLHFHRNGAEDITGTPAVARGNAVVDTPGWGIVHHDSHLVLEDNVVFDVVGAGIVAESGNEIGLWRNNLTIKTTGVDFDNVRATEDARDRKFDFGFKGEGYWVQGAAQVAMLDNIAISANNAGIAIFGDTLNPQEDFRDKETISVASLPPEIRSRIAPPGQTEVDINDVPLRQLSGFQSYNTRDGILLWAHKTNFDGQLDFNGLEPRTAHTLRSTIDDFAVWGVRATGLKVQYSSHTDIQDGLVLGSNLEDPRGRGIFQNHASYNINFKDLTVKGFDQGLRLEPLNEDKDFISSSLSNSRFSDNRYNLAPVGGDPVNQGKLPDDFPAYFKIINTDFDVPDNNAAPVARFGATAIGGLAIAFNGSTSFDRDPLKAEGKTLSKDLESNAIAAYGWDFDNNGTIDQFGRRASHHFATPGSKQVSLTVWDNQGATRTLTKTVNVQSTAYRNPFTDNNFSDSTSFGEGYKASSLGAGLGWLATKGVRRSGGAAVLSHPDHYGNGVAQIVQDNKARRGRQTLGLRLKNTEGSGKINNDIEISLWGVNGQFQNKIYDKAQPYQVGTLPLQSQKLADITLGGTSFDWRYFQWNVDLKDGYQFLLLQVNTANAKDPGDFIGLDNVRLFGDGTAGTSAIPTGDNRYYIGGTDGDDVAAGSARHQVLGGGDGNDSLHGLAGDDSLYGDEGNDRLAGNKGRDKLHGHEGNDSLFGGDGPDSLYGAEGKDVLVGGQGTDKLYGGDDDDKLFGGTEDDSLYGGTGNDSLYGGRGAGNDSLFGDKGNDLLDGGAGKDTLNGHTGDDTLRGRDGNDVLYGSDGRDLLEGQGGNDTLNSGIGNDELLGGHGRDSLYGDDGNDTLIGGSGNDSVNGGKGNDRLVGVDIDSATPGKGEKDMLIGWEGNNTFVLGDANGVYYDDGRSDTAGLIDYALVKGFKQSEGSKIQLHGQASDYQIGSIPAALGLEESGSAIYLKTSGTDELIAILAYENAPDLTSASFVYV